MRRQSRRNAAIFHFLQTHTQVRLVGGDKTDVQLVKLLPNTAYGVSVMALHGESASKPLSDQGVTRMWLTRKRGSFVFCGGGAVPDLSLPPCSAAAARGPAQGSGRHPQHHEPRLGCCSWACGEVPHHLQTGQRRGQRSKFPLAPPPFPGAVIKPGLEKSTFILFFFSGGLPGPVLCSSHQS